MYIIIGVKVMTLVFHFTKLSGSGN